MGREAGAAQEPTAGRRKDNGRKRRLVEKVRVVDDTTRRDIQARWLGTLDSDGHGVSAPADTAADDDDYNPLLDQDNDDGDVAVGRPAKRARQVPKRKSRAAAPPSKTQVKGLARFNKPMVDVLRDDDPAEYPPGRPTFEQITARPSLLPSRPLCTVCGYHAPYTCVRCGARFCSLKCSKTHEDTRCLKWTM